MKQTPPLQGQAQQQQLLLLQPPPASQQQLGQQLLQHQMQQQQPMLPPHGQPVQLQQPVLQQHHQLLVQQQQQQHPGLHQQLQQQQRCLGPLQGLPQQPFALHHQHMQVVPLQQQQQQPYVHPSPLQQQFAQQAQMQLQHLPENLQQQQLQLQNHHTIPNPQRHFVQQQQQPQQLHARQHQLSPQRQQSPLQPHQLPHPQLQQQQLQQLHEVQQQQLLHQQPQQRQEAVSSLIHHVPNPVGAGSCNSSSTNSSSIVGLQGPPLTPRLPQISRGPSQGPPKSAATPTAAPGVTVATAHIDAVQVPARPGSASTVADLVREAIEAGEAAEYEPDSYGVIREADEGFAEDDLLDFTEDIAALMEAFLNPSVAVAAQTLEVTVQLALDFIDELVAKGLEARRQHDDTVGNSQEGARPHPQLHAEDLLAALRSHPRKALRCREALDNYRQLEEFKCAFPEERYLSAPGPIQPPVSPRGGATPVAQSSGGASPQGQKPQAQFPTLSQQGQAAQYEASVGLPRASPQAERLCGHSPTPAIRPQQHDAGLDSRPPVTPTAASVLPMGI